MESKLSIGTVLSNTFETIGSNPLATLGVTFLIGTLPRELFSVVRTDGLVSVAQLFTTSRGLAFYFASLGLSRFCSMLVQAMLVRVTVAHARDEKASIGASLIAALSKLLPLIGLTLLMELAMLIGMLFLIVPGVILYVMWCVANPALVAEDIGILDAFARSAQLTKGNRWRIFGLLLLLVAAVLTVSETLSIYLPASSLLRQMIGGNINAVQIASWIVSASVGTLMTAVSGTLIANLYVELRTMKEGPVVDTLADVFA